MHKFLFINSVYFKIHPTGTLGADIKIKIENILGQALRGCKLAWDFPWLPAKPAAFTPAALSCSRLSQIKSAPPLQSILQGEKGREKEVRSPRYLRAKPFGARSVWMRPEMNGRPTWVKEHRCAPHLSSVVARCCSWVVQRCSPTEGSLQ